MRALFVSALLAMGPLLGAASANPISFEGDSALESVTSACSAIGINTDQYFTTTFSYANGTSGAVDALAIITSRGALRVASLDQSTSLNGTVSVYETAINGRAGLANYNDTTSLALSTVGGNTLATAVNVKVLGTINDFFTAGCSITIHGLLVVRPLQ